MSDAKIIQCPNCLRYQEPEALFFHLCGCGTVIKDWISVNPIDEMNNLQTENARLREALETARQLLTNVSDNINVDDMGDLVCEFSIEEAGIIDSFLNYTAEGHHESE